MTCYVIVVVHKFIVGMGLSHYVVFAQNSGFPDIRNMEWRTLHLDMPQPCNAAKTVPTNESQKHHTIRIEFSHKIGIFVNTFLYVEKR